MRSSYTNKCKNQNLGLYHHISIYKLIKYLSTIITSSLWRTETSLLALISTTPPIFLIVFELKNCIYARTTCLQIFMKVGSTVSYPWRNIQTYIQALIYSSSLASPGRGQIVFYHFYPGGSVTNLEYG